MPTRQDYIQATKKLYKACKNCSFLINMFYLQMSAAPIDGLMFDHLYRMRIGRLSILYKFQGEMFLYNCNKFIAITILIQSDMVI